jgi:hypothetical protein
MKSSVILREGLIGILLLIAALATFSLAWRYSFTDGATGTIGGESTIGALRVLRGDIPYRDFWTLYAPGHFYLLALIFRIFGAQLMVEVVAGSVLCALAIGSSYILIRAVTRDAVLAIAVAAILFAALLNSAYYLRLETYPPTILCVVASLGLVASFYQTAQTRYLFLAGLATGLVTLFKHDVGAYTSIGICAGLSVHHWLTEVRPISRWRAWLSQLIIFGAALLAVVLPVAIYFAIVAGPDIWQDVVVFPLTDWRFSRPENYPGLLDLNLHAAKLGDLIDHLSDYAKFTIPLVINVLGLGAMRLAVRQRKAFWAAMSTSFWVAFWFHYMGAHLQINTHIITMAMYAAALGAICCKLVWEKTNARQNLPARGIASLVFLLWFFALAWRPAYNLVRQQSNPTVELNLPGISGFRVAPYEAMTINALADFVNKNSTPDQYLYIGLNRHDTMLTNDLLGYLFLARPIPVRYHDLHPAVADRSKAQREMISDLESKRPPLIVIKSYFSDEELDAIKAGFQKNLPGVGATDLDEYIHAHYVAAADFSPYRVLSRIKP